MPGMLLLMLEAVGMLWASQHEICWIEEAALLSSAGQMERVIA